MSTATTPRATRRQIPDQSHSVPQPPSRGASGSRAKRGGKVLFEVPFASAMSDSDLQVLVRLLNLTTHMHPKMQPDPNSPGVARLDHFSGLFLERGPVSGRWVLEGRTWGQPAPESVHEWHVLAAFAAHQPDPTVSMPDRQMERQSGEPTGEQAEGSEPATLPRCCQGWVAEQSHAWRR